MSEKLLYGVLLLIRLGVCISSTGMIHPDEFFQSQEIMARHFISETQASKLFTPWEFDPASPNRSILFPMIVAGLPYKVLASLGLASDGYLLLIAPRLLLFVLSLLTDCLMYCLARKLQTTSAFRTLLLYASSWPVLLLLTRPFSNTFETFIFTLSLAALFLLNPHKRLLFGCLHQQTSVLGCLLAIGFFTRFTFIFFFFPLGIYLVHTQDQLYVAAWTKKTSASTMSRLGNVVLTGLQGLLSFLLVSSLIVTLDTWYFASFPTTFQGLVIAPYNNFLYNTKYDNLELHGVHPRFTHAVVNMPLLFGPLVLFHSKASSLPTVFTLSSILFPLLCLSIAPHQEARFLLPLLVPLHLFYRPSSKAMAIFSIVFNAVVLVFYGYLHQGGIIPMLLALSSHLTLPSTLPASCSFTNTVELASTLVFYKTYMPPRFLLSSILDQTNVSDVGGDTRVLESVVAAHFVTHDEHPMYVITPASIPLSKTLDDVHTSDVQITYIGGCSPHISTEDMDMSAPQTLDLYFLSRNE